MIWPLLIACSPESPVDPDTFATTFDRGRHPFAGANSTSAGRTLWSLEVFGGRVWAGYGDWEQNTGPVQLTGFHPAGGWSEPIEVDTEAITHFRLLNDTLFVPPIDPLADTATLWHGRVEEDVVWEALDIGAASHVFDVARVDDTLLVTGSLELDATIWTSVAGAPFTLERVDAPETGTFARYYGAATLDDVVYTQRSDPRGEGVLESLTFANAAFAPGTAMVPETLTGVFRPQRFDDALVYLTGTPFGFHANTLYRYDGSAPYEVRDGIRDVVVRDGRVWVLTDDATVEVSDDLETWLWVGDTPEDAWSLAVDGRTLWFGTASSHLHSATLADSGL